MTAFITSLSRLRSATICFRRRFSSSSCLRRLASLTCIPAYLLFQAYSVAALPPSSRATSAVLRPPSVCLTAAILFSSLCRLFFILVLLSKLEKSNDGWESVPGGGHLDA